MRHKYKFNPESLSYDKITPGLKHLLFRGFTLFLASIAVAFGYYFVYTSFFDSPREKALKREVQQMQFQYELLSNKLDQVEQVLNDLQQRDDNIYRAIFESAPVTDSARMLGLKNVNRYQELEDLENGKLIERLNERLDGITRRLYVQSKSYDEILAKAQSKESMWASTPAIQPISNSSLNYYSSGFGMRMHPIYKIMRFHYGLDFAAPVGSEIYATAEGTVKEVDVKGRTANGLKIVIDHGFGYETYYAHLSKIVVRQGQTVKRGQVIGLVGNTGVSTGAHLHYEVHKNGKPVNPINYFFNDLSAQEYAEILTQSNTGQSFD